MRISHLRLPLVAALMLPVLPATALAQQMSKEEQAIYDAMIKKAGVDPKLVKGAQVAGSAANKWLSKNGVVHYRIVGIYKGAPNVVGGSNWIGVADVVDRVEIDLDWNLSESKLVGTPTFKNFNSTVGKVRDPEGKCRPPALQGPFEQFTLTGIKQGLGGALDLLSTTSYPAAQVTQNCTGSPHAVPASVSKRSEHFVVQSPVLLGTARLGGKGDVKVSADGKSLVYSKGGWTWTQTPSLR